MHGPKGSDLKEILNQRKTNGITLKLILKLRLKEMRGKIRIYLVKKSCQHTISCKTKI
nr:MAG TPA_asm: hypothetical protein [Caudoviricetes sp.]